MFLRASYLPLSCPGCDTCLLGTELDSHILTCPVLALSCPALGSCPQFSVDREKFFVHFLGHFTTPPSTPFREASPGEKIFEGVSGNFIYTRVGRDFVIPCLPVSVSFPLVRKGETVFQWQPVYVEARKREVLVLFRDIGDSYYVAAVSNLRSELPVG